jgi:hypothetical protein
MANVTGFDPAPSGQEPLDSVGNKVPVGVWGDSTTGVGVFGTTAVALFGGTAPPDPRLFISPPAGVEGHGVGTEGVIGRSVDLFGIAGISDTFGGLIGITVSTDPTIAGTYGFCGTNNGVGVRGSVVFGEGVVGESNVAGTGVHGTTLGGVGVLGESYGSGLTDGTELGRYGVYGGTDTGAGVHGVSTTANGTEGVTLGDGYGVHGLHFSTDSGGGVFGESVLGNGVEGVSFSQDPDTAAVRGQNAHGFAGLFIGDVRVTGALDKPGGGFRVDHPLDPENKCLSHSFVESPEMTNIYSGTVTTDDHGDARVALPDYFEALNRDFRYQLTVIGQFARVMVSEEIKRNEFAIQSDAPHVKVCWQVTGVRRDAWAEAHRIPVEEDKPAAEKGTLPASRGVRSQGCEPRLRTAPVHRADGGPSGPPSVPRREGALRPRGDWAREKPGSA